MTAKRALDVLLAGLGLLVASPLLVIVLFLVWRYDRHSPFYVAERIGLHGRPFRMVKIRSMIVNDIPVDSTAADDPRITPIGRFIRRYKIDELSQLWNVLKGDMSLVGPRPNVPREVALYTEEECRLLLVKPGITDLASIVFSDEGEILKGKDDPDLAYHQLIRPWKSRLGLVYVENQSLWLDLEILWLTAVSSLISRQSALNGVARVLRRLGASQELIDVAQRHRPLSPAAPPGQLHVVSTRSIPTPPTALRDRHCNISTYESLR